MTTPHDDNLSEAAAALSADDGDVASPLPSRAPTKKAKAETKPVVANAKTVAAGRANERRIKIILEDNDQIPPGGQFVAVDGRTFLLQPNHEMDVPECVLDVLDHAVMSVPITDDSQTVIGYRDRLRFPYRIVRDRAR